MMLNFFPHLSWTCFRNVLKYEIRTLSNKIRNMNVLIFLIIIIWGLILKHLSFFFFFITRQVLKPFPPILNVFVLCSRALLNFHFSTKNYAPLGIWRKRITKSFNNLTIHMKGTSQLAFTACYVMTIEGMINIW